MAILDFLQVTEIGPGDRENWSFLSNSLFESQRFDSLLECENASLQNEWHC